MTACPPSPPPRPSWPPACAWPSPGWPGGCAPSFPASCRRPSWPRWPAWSGSGPMTLGELSAAERVKPPTMTKIVACLEEQGLVSRTVDQSDRRVARVEATAAGLAFLEDSRQQKDAYLAQRLRSLVRRGPDRARAGRRGPRAHPRDDGDRYAPTCGPSGPAPSGRCASATTGCSSSASSSRSPARGCRRWPRAGWC